MACLASVTYDPAAVATVPTSALLAMTALDTTNARVTFTAPANGTVLVRVRLADKGATTIATVLLGVLDGATVRGRQAPVVHILGNLGAAANLHQHEAAFLVTGLTAGTSYTWDAAYAVQVIGASTNLGWGGPNDATTSNAYGALSFEVWDTANLLAGTMYDPAVAVSKATSAALAMTAIDTTNLRLTFTAPASGLVLVRLRCVNTGAASVPSIHLGVLDGATVRGRQAAFAFMGHNTSISQLAACQSEFVVGGLTPGNSYTWDAAYGVDFAVASTNIRYGGPNDAAGLDAYGGFAYEVWAA